MQPLWYVLSASALVGAATALAVSEFRRWRQEQQRTAGSLLIKKIRARLETIEPQDARPEGTVVDHPFAELVDLACGRTGASGRHARVFLEFLALSLEEQHAELQRYLARQEDPVALLRAWARERWYERLVPSGAQAAEGELFISDFEIIAAIAYSDLQPEEGSPDLIRPGTAPAHREVSLVKLKLANLKRALHIRGWTGRPRYRCR